MAEELPRRPNPARSKVSAPPLRLFLCSGCLPPHAGSPALEPEAGGRGGARTVAVGSRASSRTMVHEPGAGRSSWTTMTAPPPRAPAAESSCGLNGGARREAAGAECVINDGE
jgi:hypothetical protein